VAHDVTNDHPFVPALSRKSFLETLGAAEALRRLDDGLGAREPFLLITGEPGTGKSALASEAIARWGARVSVAFVTVPVASASEMLEDLARRLGGDPPPGASRSRLIACLESALADIAARGQVAIAMVDDAHHLSAECLEELRLIASNAQQRQRPFEVLLVGLPQLEATLEQSDLAAVRQRVSARARLQVLTPGETRRYIRHRVAAAGDDRTNLFPRKTCAEIAELSGGVPRRINTLAAEALRISREQGQPTVDPAHVRAAAAALTGALPRSDVDPTEPADEPDAAARPSAPKPPATAAPEPVMTTVNTPAVAPAPIPGPQAASRPAESAPTMSAATLAPAAPKPVPLAAAAPAAPKPVPVAAPAPAAPRPVPVATSAPAPAAPKPKPTAASAPAAPKPAETASTKPAAPPRTEAAHALAEPAAATVPPTHHDAQEWVARFLGDQGPIQISSRAGGGFSPARAPSRRGPAVPDHLLEAVRVDDAMEHRAATPEAEDPAAEFIDQVVHHRRGSAKGLRVATIGVLSAFALIAIIVLGMRAMSGAGGHAAASSASLSPDAASGAKSAEPSRSAREKPPAPSEPARASDAGTDAAATIPRGMCTLDTGALFDLQGALDERARLENLTGIQAWVAPAGDRESGQYRVVIGIFRSYSRALGAAHHLMASHTLSHVTVVAMPPRRTRQ
jgi:general secretion pathway protein A